MIDLDKENFQVISKIILERERNNKSLLYASCICLIMNIT